MMSENRETARAIRAIMSPWTWTRSLLPRLLHPRSAVRRAHVRRGEDDGHLLSAGLSGADAEAEHLSFYPTAAAAQEAGFRPCLRCRPEASPDLGAWRGTSNTVSRALALIEEGALDDGDVGRARRAARRRRAAAAPALPPASRRVADRGGADAARAARQAADPGDAAADDRGGAGVRLRQRAAVQRDLPAAVRPPAGRACAAAHAGPTRRRRSGVDPAPRYRPPYDWDAMIAFLARAGHPRGRDGVRRALRAHDRDRRRRGTVIVAPRRRRDALRREIRFPTAAALPAVIARMRRVFDLAADPR